MVSQIVNELVANGATVHRNQPLGTVTINEEFTLRFATARCIQRPVGDRWPIRLHRTVKTDATLVARLTPTNDSVQDYCLFPHTMPWPPQITVGLDSGFPTGVYRFDDLCFLKGLALRNSGAAAESTKNASDERAYRIAT